MLETIDLIDGADVFKIFTPNVIDLLEKGDGPDAHERPIAGYCSTQRRDRQEEVVLAKGLDFSEFLECGFFNDNHKQDTHDALGWPEEVVLKSNRWWTKGYLVPDYTPSDKIWELAKALKKSNAPRRLGFSIEGKVIERGLDNRILKAKIRHVAITNSPVNVDCTWTVLTKAMGVVDQMDAVDARKAVAAGYQGPASAGGAALRSESVEGGKKKDMINLTFDEAVKKVKKAHPQWSWGVCERTTRLMFRLEERKQ